MFSATDPAPAPSSKSATVIRAFLFRFLLALRARRKCWSLSSFFATVYFLSLKSNPIDEANFLEDYGHTVITSGSSLMEAILNFEQVKQQQAAS